MPKDQQLLFHLDLRKYDEGLSDDDVAKELGVARNTFLTHRRQLQAVLKKHLVGEGGSPP